MATIPLDVEEVKRRVVKKYGRKLEEGKIKHVRHARRGSQETMQRILDYILFLAGDLEFSKRIENTHKKVRELFPEISRELDEHYTRVILKRLKS